MTITRTAPSASRMGVGRIETSHTIQWKVIEDGLWIGTSRGEFAGMIESTTGGDFAAMTSLGEQLGTFSTVDAAKRSFVG
jgi:hypothetical protein